MTQATRLFLPVRLLLAKSAATPVKIANQPGFAFYGGRWHKTGHDKPAPKGSPLAHHPEAAGKHAPAKHFEDHEWESLKLAADNVNAPSHNKALDKLKELSEGGHVTGILGMQFGTNTYGKKLSTVANKLLSLHGSAHQVVPGQKAGEHAAVQASATAEPLPAPAPASVPAKSPFEQEMLSDSPLSESMSKMLMGMSSQELQKIVDNPDGWPKVKGFAQKLLDKKKASAAPAPRPKNTVIKMKMAGADVVIAPAFGGVKLHINGDMKGSFPTAEAAQAEAHHLLTGGAGPGAPDEVPATAPAAPEPAPPAASDLAMPEFAEGKTKTGVKAYYEKVAKKIIDHAEAGNVAVLDGMPEPEKGNTWKGKTANSKKILALHAQALAHAKGGASAAPAQTSAAPEPSAEGMTTVEPSTGKIGSTTFPTPPASFESYDEAQAWVAKRAKANGMGTKAFTASHEYAAAMPALKAAYDVANAAHKDKVAAMNVAALEQMVSQGLKIGDTVAWSQGGAFMTSTKYEGQLVMHNGLPHVKLAHDAAVSKPGGKIGYTKFLPWQPHMKAKEAVAPAPAPDEKVTELSAKQVEGLKGWIAAGQPTSKHPSSWSNLWKKLSPGMKAAVKADDAPAPAAPSAPAGAVSAGQLGNLQSIPWYKQKLPPENTNAKSHNAAVAKIEAMAFAGDKAGLQAFVDSKAGAKQSYAKKQALLAQTAIAALESGAPAPAAAPAPVSVAAPAATSPSGHPLAGTAESKALVASWVASISAGEVPTKAAADHMEFHMEDAAGDQDVAMQAFMESVNNSVPAGTGDDDFDEALEEYQSKAHDLQNKALAGQDGPKEGDTKPGADGGTLVLKNGHWVKQGGEPSPAPSPAPAAAAPDHYVVLQNTNPGHSKFYKLELSADGMTVKTSWGKIGTKGASDTANYASPEKALEAIQKIKKQKLAGGYTHWSSGGKLAAKDTSSAKGTIKLTSKQVGAIIKGITPSQTKFSTNMASKMANAAIKAGDGPGMAAAYSMALDVGYSKTAKHIKAVAEAMNVDTGAWVDDATAAPATASTAAPAHPSMDGWTQVGPQAGSNEGGKFRDEAGNDWYCKFPGDEATARSEILAAKLYALAGMSSQDCQLVQKGGKVGIATKWHNIKKASNAAALAKVEGVHSGFAVDAWLANWDVVGLSLDNLQIGPDGKAHRVDAGGSLEYRAQGEKKPFGGKVDEIDTLRDPIKNPHSAAVFGKMTEADIVASVAKIAAINDVSIRAMVNQHGPGTQAEKDKLAATLIARKADLLARFPKAAKTKKSIRFKASEISAPPSFTNWGGTGSSGPSSKEFLNLANEKAVQAIYAAAKTGDVEAIKTLKADVFNKDSGAVTGSAAVLDHPSQHVKGYAQQAVNEINYQLNPPKKFRFDGGHPLHTLNAAYPAHAGAKSSAAVQTLGKFLVLGEPGKITLADMGLPEKVTHAEGGGKLSASTYAKAAQSALAQMPKTQQEAIQSYTGSSYHAMNGSLWSGNPSGAAKAAGEGLKTLGHEIQPGTILSRKVSIHGADLNLLLNSAGKVLQEPAIMSTSIRPSSWVGNVHLKLHVGPGVKGLWVGKGSSPTGGALSIHSGEDEMILPPNTRLLIISVKPGGGDEDGFGKSSAHVIEAVILPTN